MKIIIKELKREELFMKLLSAVISLNSSFWMMMYLYGLKKTNSSQYNPIFNILVLILVCYQYAVLFTSQKQKTYKVHITESNF